MKDEDGRVLSKKDDIKRRWRKYFSRLLNESQGLKMYISENPDTNRQRDCGPGSGITTEKVGKTQSMRRAMVVGPDNIPIEVWRCLGEKGI